MRSLFTSICLCFASAACYGQDQGQDFESQIELMDVAAPSDSKIVAEEKLQYAKASHAAAQSEGITELATSLLKPSLSVQAVAQNNVLPDPVQSTLLDQARTAAAAGNIIVAEPLFVRYLESKIKGNERADALVEMAKMYESARDPVKEIGVYETFVDLFPKDARTPGIYLTLGRCYRGMGVTDMALKNFYTVLQVAVGFDESSGGAFRELSKQAQLEITNTYFQDGQYEEAQKFFDRLTRLDLTDEERTEVLFKEAYVCYVMKDYPRAMAKFKEFVAKYPNIPESLEALYLLSDTLRRLGRYPEAAAEVEVLLGKEPIAGSLDPDVLLYWKKRTGNQLANELYEQGDYLSALTLYQAMASLSNTPQWQWPVIYQIGLCFERLHMYEKAQEAYRLIASGQLPDKSDEQPDAQTPAPQKQIESISGAAAEELPPSSLDLIQSNAQWRLQNVQWIIKTDSQVADLLSGQSVSSVGGN